MGSIQL